MIPNTCNYVFKHDYEINPLHLNISMHILNTVPYTFPKVLMRRIFYIPELLLLVTISFILRTLMCDLGVIL